MSVDSATVTYAGGASAYRAIVFGSLIAGTMDITAAAVLSTINGRGAVVMLKGIAAGVLGKAAFSKGVGAAVLGLAIHFLIATSACVVFYAGSRWIHFMISRPVVTGLLYGIAVYLFMNLVVLPLAYPLKVPYSTASVTIGLIVHMVCVGLPISLVVSHYGK